MYGCADINVDLLTYDVMTKEFVDAMPDGRVLDPDDCTAVIVDGEVHVDLDMRQIYMVAPDTERVRFRVRILPNISGKTLPEVQDQIKDQIKDLDNGILVDGCMEARPPAAEAATDEETASVIDELTPVVADNSYENDNQDCWAIIPPAEKKPTEEPLSFDVELAHIKAEFYNQIQAQLDCSNKIEEKSIDPLRKTVKFGGKNAPEKTLTIINDSKISDAVADELTPVVADNSYENDNQDCWVEFFFKQRQKYIDSLSTDDVAAVAAFNRVNTILDKLKDAIARTRSADAVSSFLQKGEITADDAFDRLLSIRQDKCLVCQKRTANHTCPCCGVRFCIKCYNDHHRHSSGGTPPSNEYLSGRISDSELREEIKGIIDDVEN